MATKVQADKELRDLPSSSLGYGRLAANKTPLFHGFYE